MGKSRYSLYPPNNRPTCQICGKMGHTAVVCYHTYDKATNNNTSPTSGAGGTNPKEEANSSTALMAFPETLQEPSWYLDNGASHHVTSDLGKLSLKGMCSTIKNVVVGN